MRIDLRGILFVKVMTLNNMSELFNRDTSSFSSIVRLSVKGATNEILMCIGSDWAIAELGRVKSDPDILQLSLVWRRPEPGPTLNCFVPEGQVMVKVSDLDMEYNHPADDFCNIGLDKAGSKCFEQNLVFPFNNDNAQEGAVSR